MGGCGRPEGPTRVYNPVSVALTLTSDVAEFSPTWTSTGRASTLMNYIRREGALAIDPKTRQLIDADVEKVQ